MNRILFSWLLLLFSGESAYSVSHEYWVAFLNPVLRGEEAEFKLQILAGVSGKVSIEIPAVGYATSIDLDSGKAEFFIPPVSLITSYKYEDPEATGILVKADFELQILAASLLFNSSDVASVFPVQMLGSRYMINTFSNETNKNRSSFIIVAVNDKTKVNILLKDTSTKGTLPNVLKTIMLQRGECYRVTAIGDLSGSEINTENGKAIAVFAGAELAAVPDITCTGYDQLYDQIPCIEQLGTEYLMGNGHVDIKEIVKIVFTAPITSLYLNNKYVGAYRKGEKYELKPVTSIHIRATAKVLVCEYMLGSICTNSLFGDPSMMVIPPLIAMCKQRMFIEPMPLKSSKEQSFYNLCVYAGNTEIDKVQFNGNAVSTFKPFQYNESYSYAKISVDKAGGTMEANTPVIAKFYAFGSYESYLYCFSAWNFLPEPQQNIAVPKLKVTIGPVPSVSDVKIFTTGPKEEADVLSYSIYDPNGRLISTEVTIESNEQVIPLSGLSGGLYYVKVSKNDFLLGTYKVIYGGAVQ
jgi:hypothetical protein